MAIVATFERVLKLALALPGMEEGTSYGTPSLRVSGKFVARMWEDGATLVVRLDFEMRDMLLLTEPEVYFLTDHYRGYPAVLVRLAAVEEDDLADVLEQAWRRAAPKRLIREFDAAS